MRANLKEQAGRCFVGRENSARSSNKWRCSWHPLPPSSPAGWAKITQIEKSLPAPGLPLQAAKKVEFHLPGSLHQGDHLVEKTEVGPVHQQSALSHV